MSFKNNPVLIEAFKVAIADDSNKISFEEMNTIAAKRGYLVHPDVCNASVASFISNIPENYNSTFYKTWADVISRDRFELFIDQIMHYMTTYGTEFSEGNGYVQNDGEQVIPGFNDYKVIMPVTPAELYSRCMKMIACGIALHNITLNAVCDYIVDYINETGEEINVDSISNKEAQIIVCSKLGVFPKNKFGLLRLIMYKTTGSAMIINNKQFIDSIKNSITPFDFNMLDNHSLEALSSIFLRYKDVLLAFKHNSRVDNRRIINKLRRMVVKNHTPMVAGFWESLFTDEKNLVDIAKEADNISNYKKVSLMESAMSRATALDDQIYIIRNGKMFIRKNYKPKASANYCLSVYGILAESLIKSMSKKSSIVTTATDQLTGEEIISSRPAIIRIPSGLEVSLPSSEKSFIGNYPIGTKYTMKEHNIIGIYWRNEWGAKDFDLSMNDENGERVAWNARYYGDDRDIIYSGDMTNADPEATELLYIKNGSTNGSIRINMYNGQNKSKLRFFVAQEDLNSHISNNGIYGYMVDPNSIKFETEIVFDGDREKQLAFVVDNSIILSNISAGVNRVSGMDCNRAKHVQLIRDTLNHKVNCSVLSTDILQRAGYQIVDETYEGYVDFDFGKMEKDTIISMMSKDE